MSTPAESPVGRRGTEFEVIVERGKIQEFAAAMQSRHPAYRGADAVFHLIGHLQSNKATRAAKIFHTIDSVDDFALAQRLDRARAELASGSRLRVLLEVRLAPETTKSGAASEDLQFLAQKIVQLPNLDLAGLMCIPPFLDDPEQVRPYFRRLRELRDPSVEIVGRNRELVALHELDDAATL